MAEDQRRGRRGGVDTSVRTSAVWDSVRDLVTRRSGELGRPLRVVDLGGGTGGLAVPLTFQTGASPSDASYIFRAADVPGGAKAVSDKFVGDDVAGFTSGG